MAAASCPEQVARPGEVLGEEPAEPAILGKAAGGSTKTDRGGVSAAPTRGPIEAAHCGPSTPRPPADPGVVVAARRVRRARSESHPAFRLGMVQKQLLGGSLLLQAGRHRHSRQRPLCAVPWPMDRATLGAGLLPHRA